MIKNKKASHVGVILSFVIFVTFLIFIFSIFGSPINFFQTKEPTLDYLEVELENMLLSNLTILTLSPEVTQNCFSVDNSVYGLQGLDIIVKNQNNEIKLSERGNTLYFYKGVDSFFKIYYAQDLSDYDVIVANKELCYSVQPEDINSFRQDYFYTEKNINNFISNYETNYSRLKEDLNLPLTTDFSFSFTNATGGVIKTEQRETSANIFAREIPVQYFNKDAEIKSGFINLKVW